MNNKPVAWIKQNPETLEAELHFDKPAKYWATVISNPDIPLYTHPVNPKYNPETGEPLIDGYPLFSGLPHPVTEHFEGEPQAEELHEILQSNAELTDEEITELANEYLCYISHEYEVTGIYKFARAILRKAQE